MVALICTFGSDHLALLPSFLDHYKKAGCVDFFISIHFRADMEASKIESAKDFAESSLTAHGQNLYKILTNSFDAQMLREHHDRIQQKIKGKYQGLVWADADEFHEFDRDLQEIAEDIYASRSALRGRLVDRVARGMSLRNIEPNDSIWSTFPIGCDITRKVLQACSDKVIFSHPEAVLTAGNHSLRNVEVVEAQVAPCPVHHFKWDQGVNERLRIRLSPEWKLRNPWYPESERAMKMTVEDNRLLLPNGLRTYDFQDDKTQCPGPYNKNPFYRSRDYWE